jgi:hypothetical protein
MCGSPNLRRREDLVRFGRHEIMKTEWHSDRMFALMGLQYVFAKDAYVTHIGDGRSKMEGKRPTNEIVTPDDFNPLKAFCRLPKIDWYFMERDYGGPPYLELNR